tara:strand:- start:1860 stop:2438 length:579 start_codon:yes stop_codon:yes gene_type:complete
MTTLPPILQAVQAKGYAVFTNGDYNLNITGIRSPQRVANAFDDRLCVTYKVNDIWTTETYEITTDPGSPYLLRPINNYGCAVLAPGQWRGCYTIGKHRGQYLALVQSSKVKVFRDNNRDNVIDMDPETLQEGYFGINIHKRDGTSDTVNGASAGCQVFRYEKEFNRMMWLANKQISERGFKSFTYTLLEEEE